MGAMDPTQESLPAVSRDQKTFALQGFDPDDDYTPMEFVVHVIQKFFNKGMEEATTIMLHVHQNGVGICGVYTYEVAETKVTQVVDFARQNQHPLQCTMERD